MLVRHAYHRHSGAAGLILKLANARGNNPIAPQAADAEN
jgi:hypothetical protein